jgi:His-Xaa-Ser system protein HxsD
MSLERQNYTIDHDRTAARIFLSKSVYSAGAVLRASYSFSKDLAFQLVEHEDNTEVVVTLRSCSPTLEQPRAKKIDEWIPDLLNAFVDFQLRVEIQAETAAVRELIVAKALAEAGVLEDAPPGVYEDSVESRSAVQHERLVNITPTSS